MDFIDFNKLLKKKELSNIYLFKGMESYLMDKYVDSIKSEYIDEAFSMINFIEIDASGNFDQILNACETLPFMSERKMIVVKDIYELSQGDKTILDKLNDYLDQVAGENILIVKDRNDKLKKTTRLYKNFNKRNALVEFNRLNPKQLSSFIDRIIRSKGKEVGQNELAYIVEKSGYLTYRSEKSLFEIENEVLKLVDSSQDSLINRADIDRTMIEDINVNIFNLIDNIMLKDNRESLLIFNRIYELGEGIPKILFMLIRHFRLLNKYKVYSSQGYGMNDINLKLKISPYELKKIDRQARNIDLEILEGILDRLLSFDVKQKTVSVDEHLLMELLIVDIIKKM